MKSSYSFSLLRDDCDSVEEVLSKSRINAKMRESQGFLLLLLLLLPLLMDSYKMMYLHAQYENKLLFNRLIAHAAVFFGKSGMAIMADMGVFCLIDRIA